MSEPLLALAGVTRRFGGTVAVDDLSFTVAPGQLTSLIGPNGAGKTTAIGLIAGRYRADAGRLTFRGRPLPTGAHHVARLGIGRLFQDVRVFPSLTVLDNLLVAAPGQAGEGIGASLFCPGRLRRQEAGARAAARAELARVGLAEREESLAGSLSYGQQKLVAIARLLVTGAELLLLDEPASGVNPRLIEAMTELFRRLVADGRTILLVEHNMMLVRAVSDAVVLLDRGHCRARGTVDEVWDSAVLREVYLGADEV